MSGQSKFTTTLIAAVGALLMSSVALTATVGPVAGTSQLEVRTYA